MSSRKRKQPKTQEVVVEEEKEDLSCLRGILPCRAKQVDNLLSLFGESWHHTVPSIFLYGHSACGKSVVVECLMEFFDLPHIIINCVECYTTSILFQEVLRGLFFHPKAEDKRSDFEPPKKCENTNDFVRWVKKMLNHFYPEETTYIILHKAERLRDREANLIPALLNLQELTACNVCVILESEIPWEKYHGSITGKKPHIMFFPDYSKENLQEILTFLRPSDSSEEFYRDYVGIVLSVFLTACRDLRELRHLAEINYPIYYEPITKGDMNESDRHKLWKNIEPHLQKALHTLYLREISSSEWAKQHTSIQEEQNSNVPSSHVVIQSDNSGAKNAMKMGFVELPFYSKFLVIAAYIASYNPVKTDIRFFLKNTGRNKKTLKSMKKDEQKSAHLKGPKAFQLDRLMAIFYSIVEGRVPPSANIFSQISSLVSLHLMTQIGHEDQIDAPRYKCIVSLDFVQSISRTVNFDVVRYLYDFI